MDEKKETFDINQWKKYLKIKQKCSDIFIIQQICQILKQEINKGNLSELIHLFKKIGPTIKEKYLTNINDDLYTLSIWNMIIFYEYWEKNYENSYKDFTKYLTDKLIDFLNSENFKDALNEIIDCENLKVYKIAKNNLTKFKNELNEFDENLGQCLGSANKLFLNKEELKKKLLAINSNLEVEEIKSFSIEKVLEEFDTSLSNKYFQIFQFSSNKIKNVLQCLYEFSQLQLFINISNEIDKLEKETQTTAIIQSVECLKLFISKIFLQRIVDNSYENVEKDLKYARRYFAHPERYIVFENLNEFKKNLSEESLNRIKSLKEIFPEAKEMIENILDKSKPEEAYNTFSSGSTIREEANTYRQQQSLVKEIYKVNENIDNANPDELKKLLNLCCEKKLTNKKLITNFNNHKEKEEFEELKQEFQKISKDILEKFSDKENKLQPNTKIILSLLDEVETSSNEKFKETLYKEKSIDEKKWKEFQIEFQELKYHAVATGVSNQSVKGIKTRALNGITKICEKEKLNPEIKDFIDSNFIKLTDINENRFTEEKEEFERLISDINDESTKDDIEANMRKWRKKVVSFQEKLDKTKNSLQAVKNNFPELAYEIIEDNEKLLSDLDDKLAEMEEEEDEDKGRKKFFSFQKKIKNIENSLFDIIHESPKDFNSCFKYLSSCCKEIENYIKNLENRYKFAIEVNNQQFSSSRFHIDSLICEGFRALKIYLENYSAERYDKYSKYLKLIYVILERVRIYRNHRTHDLLRSDFNVDDVLYIMGPCCLETINNLEDERHIFITHGCMKRENKTDLYEIDDKLCQIVHLQAKIGNKQKIMSSYLKGAIFTLDSRIGTPYKIAIESIYEKSEIKDISAKLKLELLTDIAYEGAIEEIESERNLKKSRLKVADFLKKLKKGIFFDIIYLDNPKMAKLLNDIEVNFVFDIAYKPSQITKETLKILKKEDEELKPTTIDLCIIYSNKIKVEKFKILDSNQPKIIFGEEFIDKTQPKIDYGTNSLTFSHFDNNVEPQADSKENDFTKNKSSEKIKGLTGLSNSKGTFCYINAIIQCLRFIPRLKSLCEQNIKINNLDTSREFYKEFSKLIENLWDDDKESISKNNFVEKIDNKFREHRQEDEQTHQDAVEFLEFLIDELCSISFSKEELAAEENNDELSIKDYFNIQLENENNPRKVLYLEKGKDISNIFEDYKFINLPNVLVLRLEKENLNSSFKIPGSINSYFLKGIVNYTGDKERGHYTAFCKNIDNDDWFEFDDSKTPEKFKSFENVNTSAAYILFYAKK